jgi:hypothetical protein
MTAYYPGNNTNKSRRVLYNAQYNYIRNMLNVNSQENAFYYPALQQQKELECNCQLINSVNITNSSTNSNESSAKRISKTIQRTGHNGKIQFGNSYLGNGFYINYLGRTPGQPGGSGQAPKNRLK